MDFFYLLKTLEAGIFLWLLTALGAGFIFMIKRFNQKIFDTMLGFAGGIMLSASFWSLLLPAVNISRNQKSAPVWLIPGWGFLCGAVFLKIIDRILPHLHLGFSREESEGMMTSWRSSLLLVLPLTLHNIPEGLAIGTAIGVLSIEGITFSALAQTLALVLGIGIQNIPEGFAVSVSLHREGVSRLRSFWYGQLSGIVEPLAGVLGFLAVSWMRKILVFAMSFAAGAMIFVVVEEVIAESQRNRNTDLATLGTILGFLLMMILDLAFT